MHFFTLCIGVKLQRQSNYKNRKSKTLGYSVLQHCIYFFDNLEKSNRLILGDLGFRYRYLAQPFTILSGTQKYSSKSRRPCSKNKAPRWSGALVLLIHATLGASKTAGDCHLFQLSAQLIPGPENRDRRFAPSAATSRRH